MHGLAWFGLRRVQFLGDEESSSESSSKPLFFLVRLARNVVVEA
jgi:hypothetical protein